MGVSVYTEYTVSCDEPGCEWYSDGFSFESLAEQALDDHLDAIHLAGKSAGG